MKLSPAEEITIASYDKAASFRKQSCSTLNFWQDKLDIFRQYLPAGNIIEIGCGIGNDAKPLISAGYGYLGIDASEGLLAEAKNLVPEAKFIQMNLYDLFSEDESGILTNHFAGAWAVNSLIHIPKVNIEYALQGIRRVVKPQGFGFVAMREGSGEPMVEDVQGNRFFALYSIDEFADILQKNSFTVLQKSRDDRGKNKFSTGFLCYHVRNDK